jgi:hypothetical protein
VATNQHRRAHHDQYVALLAAYAGATPAGPRLVYKIGRRAQRLLQLAHPEEYQALYAAERAKIGNPRPSMRGAAPACRNPAGSLVTCSPVGVVVRRSPPPAGGTPSHREQGGNRDGVHGQVAGSTAALIRCVRLGRMRPTGRG